jgi:mannose-1-phosphate guanylyltransferase
MLQFTVKRLLPRIPAERLAVVTNADQAGLIHQELQRQGCEKVRIWIEPQGRNTAAAVGLAALYLTEEAETAVMAVFPADHFIRDRASLLQALDLGAAWAQAGYLVTLGISPTRPETGYGYIKQGAPLDDQGRAFRAARFTEKPPCCGPRSLSPKGGTIGIAASSCSAAIFCWTPFPGICRTCTGN